MELEGKQKPKRKQEDLVLEAKNFFNAYKKELGESVRRDEGVVRLDFQQLQSYSPVLADNILELPEETIAVLELALEEMGLLEKPRVRIVELPKSCNVYIRAIRARHLDKLVAIEGLVRQASEVRPQVVNARFECPNCGAILSVLQIERKFREPSRCSCGWKGNFKLLSKEMVDAQRLVIEESPDTLEGGEQPRRMNIFLKEDLVDIKMEKKTTPGSRVRIYGVLKEVPVPLQTGAISTRFDIALEANNTISMEESFEELEMSDEDEKQILELAADPNIFKRLSQSISPSIYGYEKIKEAVLLQLFGGVKKKRSDGGATRGDIHVLLVGDPGVAKSVLLKYVSTIAPKGRYVSGKAATAAGLTAAVVKDEFLRGWSLEGGAMVLSNKGVVCIDEIEKMDEHDRSTMHEAMEQQSVTISKANIQATLRAETTVLAAGNPKLGRFDPYTPIPQQIDISPALLSRFDVLFVIRDLPNRKQDESVASHVLEEHKQEVIRDVVDSKLLRKYIAYAKQKIKPKLSDEAIEEIKEFYIRLRGQPGRSDSEIKPIPITARQLEGLVRLSEAHARMRLSEEVKAEDSRVAIELLKFSLMQVGYDEETKSFDIDRVTTGVTASKRGKILLVKETLSQLESRLGKLIPLEELERAVEGKMTETELEEAIDQLSKAGDIFKPRKGYLQRL
ncbi:MAG: minichromosome maintenance protein MCM [Nanoarchaeota archaeon]|nr:minichromosome maintenance protein MCM [Nanoarchaeota archaeon]MBU1051803.1 minichromosome maintenance protein MCM [Nanoarchaeota archaeon]